MQSAGVLQPQSLHHNVILAPPYPNVPKFGPRLPQVQQCKSAHICPSTAYYMSVLKHFIYIQYGCAMQSAGVCSLKHDTTISFGLHLTPISPNLAPTPHRYNSVRVHPYAYPQHAIWRCSNTLYTSNMDVGCSQRGFATSTSHLGSTLPQLPQIWPPPPTGITVQGCTYMPIHSTWRCSNMNVESSQQGFRASTMSSSHHFITTLTPNYQNLGQQLCHFNCVRVLQNAHPQRMKVLKHFSYI